MGMSTIEQRFWAKVRKTDTCWLWTAATSSGGYGSFGGIDRKIIGAHRFSYQLHYGPIPHDMCVLHSCDTPPCVNPDHLFLGTDADNIRDMMAKGRKVAGGTHCGKNGKYERGEQRQQAKLTAAQVQEMRQIHARGGLSYPKLGTMFGIHATTARNIVKRIKWKHI
jgi:hypothetical protein